MTYLNGTNCNSLLAKVPLWTPSLPLSNFVGFFFREANNMAHLVLAQEALPLMYLKG